MSSISPECNPSKEKYDACFNAWYSDKFLKGIITRECDELYKEYQDCVWKVIKEKKIDVLIKQSEKDK